MITTITGWYRLDPRPRAAGYDLGLQARVHDPLWMLCRQWQTGEFQGEDAGAPTLVEFQSRTAPLTHWRPSERSDFLPSPAQQALEDVACGERFSAADLSLRAELGTVFEDALIDGGIPASSEALRRLRAAFSLGGEGEAPGEHDTPQARAFLRLAAGRLLDGWRILESLVARSPTSVTDFFPVEQQSVVEAALEAVRDWVRDVYGEVAPAETAPRVSDPLGSDVVAAEPRRANGTDPSGWVYERLENSFELRQLATQPGELGIARDQINRFVVEPDESGDIDWYSIDLVDVETKPVSGGTVRSHRVLPSRISISGMPAARWWDFEDSASSLVRMEAEPNDLVRLMFLHFLLVGNIDWFMAPVEVPVGSLCWIEPDLPSEARAQGGVIRVTDVFGQISRIYRVDEGIVGDTLLGTQRWSMFSTSRPKQRDSQDDLANFLVVAPSYARTHIVGRKLEEVRFLRDEMANLVWGVEHMAEDRIGESRRGDERAKPVVSGWERPEDGSTEGLPPTASPSLRYRVRTDVPPHWFPYVARQFSRVTGQVFLERASLARGLGTEESVARGRILPGHPRLWEEEVPRSGVRVLRQSRRARSADGVARIWIDRHAEAGTGEGSSGLRFDLTEPIIEEG